jgi:hypothetical protein
MLWIIPRYQRLLSASRFLHRGCRRPASVLAVTAALVAAPASVSAIQVHPAPEGLYAHQIAHLFLALSLGFFAFWLQRRRLVETRGWRLIQAACLLLVLWNLAAMTGHHLEGRLPEEALRSVDGERFLAVDGPWTVLYYFLKMDHFFCVPAMALFYLGLRRLRGGSGGETP